MIGRGLLLGGVFGAAGAVCVAALAGCERGCGWAWLREHGVATGRGVDVPPAAGRPRGSGGPLALQVVDCPDGLARCAEGSVSASRLTTIQMPCRTPDQGCECPWDPVGACEGACVVDGLEVAVERPRALAQLCAPSRDAGVFALPLGDGLTPGGRATEELPATVLACDEDERFRCAAGRVVDCVAHVAVGSCLRGCAAEGISTDDPEKRVRREDAFAILCRR